MGVSFYSYVFRIFTNCRHPKTYRLHSSSSFDLILLSSYCLSFLSSSSSVLSQVRIPLRYVSPRSSSATPYFDISGKVDSCRSGIVHIAYLSAASQWGDSKWPCIGLQFPLRPFKLEIPPFLLAILCLRSCVVILPYFYTLLFLFLVLLLVISVTFSCSAPLEFLVTPISTCTFPLFLSSSLVHFFSSYFFSLQPA